MPRSAIVRFRKQRKEAVSRRNPASGIKGDLIGTIAPAAVAFAATKLLTRIVGTIVARRWPRAAPHVAALSSIAAFGGVYYFGDRYQRLKPYHTPAMVGAGVAALTTVAQTYVKKYGWITADWQPTDAKARMAAASSVAELQPAGDEFSSYEDEIGAMGATAPAMAAPTYSFNPSPADDMTADEKAAYNQASDALDLDDDEGDLTAMAAGVFAS
jgi:hypothetical protein